VKASQLAARHKLLGGMTGFETHTAKFVAPMIVSVLSLVDIRAPPFPPLSPPQPNVMRRMTHVEVSTDSEMHTAEFVTPINFCVQSLVQICTPAHFGPKIWPNKWASQPMPTAKFRGGWSGCKE
jgi:hypothetical protein